MFKVLVDTHLTKLPKSCSKCKYSISEESNKICILTGLTIKKTYVKEKKNYCFEIPKNCPLELYDVEE